MRYFLVDYHHRRPPDEVDAFVHIKARADGLVVAGCTNSDINGTDVIELPFDDMQAQLNSWIDDENVTPAIDVTTGEPILQLYLDLSQWVDVG